MALRHGSGADLNRQPETRRHPRGHLRPLRLAVPLAGPAAGPRPEARQTASHGDRDAGPQRPQAQLDVASAPARLRVMSLVSPASHTARVVNARLLHSAEGLKARGSIFAASPCRTEGGRAMEPVTRPSSERAACHWHWLPVAVGSASDSGHRGAAQGGWTDALLSTHAQAQTPRSKRVSRSAPPLMRFQD